MGAAHRFAAGPADRVPREGPLPAGRARAGAAPPLLPPQSLFVRGLQSGEPSLARGLAANAHREARPAERPPASALTLSTTTGGGNLGLHFIWEELEAQRLSHTSRELWSAEAGAVQRCHPQPH